MAQIDLTVGLDCGKRFLDAALVPGTDHQRVENTPSGRHALVDWIKQRGAHRIGLEASGGYERPVRDDLCQAGLEVHLLNPARVRHFAEAQGQRAKTDALDAPIIGLFTALLVTTPPVTPDAAREERAGLIRARQLLVDKRADLTKALAHVPALAKAAFETLLAHLDHAIEDLETTLHHQVDSDPTLSQTLKALQSAPGIGWWTAVVLAIRLPELGQTSAAKIAALLGVAPYDDESGEHHGVRHIEGGRAEARKALYMAVLAPATRGTGVLGRFYARLIARGKPSKVALTACMRKMIVRLNAMLATGQRWHEEPG